MNDSILILGGAGFIGSHLCDSLIDKFNLVVVDDLSLGRINNIKHLQNHKNFNFIEVDILSEDFENVFLNFKITTVFHLAANSDIAKSYDDPNFDINNTLRTTLRTLDLMKKYSCKEIVFASSSAIYGDVKIKISESYGPLFPHSHYGAAKLGSEAFISSYCINYNFNSWIIRFPNVIGERCTHGVIYDFISKIKKNPNELIILGNGKQKKPYLYVKDLVEGILFVKNNAHDQINFFNLGVDSSTTVNEIADILINELKTKTKKIFTGGDIGWIGDVPKFDYDLEKIHNLGWKAKYTSNESVKKSIVKALKNWMQ